MLRVIPLGLALVLPSDIGYYFDSHFIIVVVVVFIFIFILLLKMCFLSIVNSFVRNKSLLTYLFYLLTRRYKFSNLAIMLDMEEEDDHLCKSLFTFVTLTKDKD